MRVWYTVERWCRYVGEGPGWWDTVSSHRSEEKARQVCPENLPDNAGGRYRVVKHEEL